MAILLKIVGGLWALLGAADIVGMPWTEGHSDAFMGFGLIFNVVLFVIPGLILYGIGARIGGPKKSAESTNVDRVEATKVCTQCGETVKAVARICRFCRYEFPADLPTTKTG